MPESRYFELNDDVGVRPDGSLEPLHEIGVAVLVPQLKGGEVVDVPERVTVAPADTLGRKPGRILPNTRLIECADPKLAGALLAHGGLHEIDPPSKRDEQHARGATQDAQRAAGTHDDQQEA